MIRKNHRLMNIYDSSIRAYMVYVFLKIVFSLTCTMSTTNSLPNSSSNRLSNFFQKTFMQEKLNNWFGYLLIISIACGFGYILADDLQMRFNCLCFNCSVVGFVIICMSNSTFAFYTIIVYSFFVEFVLRLFFGGKFTTGVVYDGLVVLTFVGMLISRNDIRLNFKSLSKSPVVIFYFFNLLYTPIQFFNPNSISIDTNLLALRKFTGYLLILFFTYTTFDSYDKVKKYINFLFLVNGTLRIVRVHSTMAWVI